MRINPSFSVAILLLFCSGNSFCQETMTGRITDKNTRQPLGFCNVLVKGTTTGASTDINGNFSIPVTFPDSGDVILVLSYVGYATMEFPVRKGMNNVKFEIEPIAIMGKEVVVSGSRVSETILESPASIQKLTTRDIRESASGDFYQSLSNLKGVDINQSSMGFKVPNMRGFNTTSPVRIVQFIDGMDNQAPGLNFPIGNLVGATEIDLNNIEIINGAASALYGPNAFQGVISMTSKDPYQYPGTSVQIKVGTRNLTEGQLRFAQTLDKDKKWALKLNGSYMSVDDWIADDTVANKYGEIETEVDLSKIIIQKQFDSLQSPEDLKEFDGLNDWLWFWPNAYPGKITVKSPGYMESDLSDNAARSVKLGGEVHYKIKDSLRLSYALKYGNGTAVYQGSNRYSINNIGFYQHKLELNGKNFFIKSYATLEDAGDSYDIVFTGINISKNHNIPHYVETYLGEYFDRMKNYTDTFSGEPQQWMVDSAHAYARDTAEKSWYKPGSKEFDSIYQKVISDPRLASGSKFQDRSAYYHVEGQYNFDIPVVDLIAGASARLYTPHSFGTIFRDTLVNRGDTLANGISNPKADFVNLNTYEFGVYAQASKKILNDKLKLMGSVRLDKSMNYDFEASPRISAIYNLHDHIFRISGQSAFRAPTLQNQYLMLNIGPVFKGRDLTLRGNLDGYDNLYTLESVKDFLELYDSTFEANDSLLKAVKYAPIRPEQVKTVEVGYRGVIKSKLYVDLNAYYSSYTNSIAETRVVEPVPADGAIAGEESGDDQILAESFNIYQIPVNAKEEVVSYGAGVGLAYYIGNKLTASANYTYSVLDTSKVLDDDLIPGFNTPKHKINLGLTGRRIFRDLGFVVNFTWVDKFNWESTFGDGPIPSYRNMDVQLFYEFPNVNSTLRVGCSNVLNEKRREAYGAPYIGRLIYGSWLIDIPELSK